MRDDANQSQSAAQSQSKRQLHGVGTDLPGEGIFSHVG